MLANEFQLLDAAIVAMAALGPALREAESDLSEGGYPVTLSCLPDGVCFQIKFQKAESYRPLSVISVGVSAANFDSDTSEKLTQALVGAV